MAHLVQIANHTALVLLAITAIAISLFLVKLRTLVAR